MFLYTQKPYILYFSNFHMNKDAIFHSISQLFYFRTNIFILKKIHKRIYIINLFSITLIYFNFNIYFTFFLIYIFFCNGFFYILFTKIQVIFINFPIPYFLVKNLFHRTQPTSYRFTGYHNSIQYFQPPAGAIILPHQ